jgi:hypothetical protein
MFLPKIRLAMIVPCCCLHEAGPADKPICSASSNCMWFALGLSYRSEQKALRHWNNVAIACCSDSGFPRFYHGVFDSGNATYKTRTDQLMLCPCVARKRSQSLKPFRNLNSVPISNPSIQEAKESYVTFRRNMAGLD